MKPIFILAFSLFFSVGIANAQVKSTYDSYVEEAENYFKANEYLKAAESFSKAFAANKDLGRTDHRYHAARAWAKAGQVDSAFYQLTRIANHGYFTDYRNVAGNPDFASLYSDSRWDALIAKFKAQQPRERPGSDSVLVAILDTIYDNDQGFRNQIPDIEKKYGYDSPEMQKHWELIRYHDSINLLKVEAILDKHGWLGKDVVGDRGHSALFLVIQHAPLASQEKYLPMMRNAVIQGKASASSLALLEDRVAMRKGQKQIYGSQIGRNLKTGAYYVLELEDPVNVDKRRAKMNLPPMSEYVKFVGLEWGIEQYEKALAENEPGKKR
ncbi:MAG: DUF6624 domain-containing protein [Arcticibacter sp.]